MCHWKKLRTQTKTSHAANGIIRLAASGLIGLKVRITITTTGSHRLTMANDHPIRCNPKNIHDQVILNNNCRAHQPRATRASPLMASQTIHADTAINTYKTAQTEVMTTGDGVQLGVNSTKYQSPPTNCPLTAVAMITNTKKKANDTSLCMFHPSRSFNSQCYLIHALLTKIDETIRCIDNAYGKHHKKQFYPIAKQDYAVISTHPDYS